MKTTADFLDLLRVKLELPSDGRLADHLGLHRQYMSEYRTLKTSFNDEMAMKIADILETDPAYVVACMHAQRAKRDVEKKLWERIANLSIGVAAVLLVSVALPFVHLPIGDAGIISNPEKSGAVYIMSNLADTYWPALILLAALALLAFPRYPRAPKKNPEHRTN